MLVHYIWFRIFCWDSRVIGTISKKVRTWQTNRDIHGWRSPRNARYTWKHDFERNASPISPSHGADWPKASASRWLEVRTLDAAPKILFQKLLLDRVEKRAKNLIGQLLVNELLPLSVKLNVTSSVFSTDFFKRSIRAINADCQTGQRFLLARTQLSKFQVSCPLKSRFLNSGSELNAVDRTRHGAELAITQSLLEALLDVTVKFDMVRRSWSRVDEKLNACQVEERRIPR